MQSQAKLMGLRGAPASTPTYKIPASSGSSWSGVLPSGSPQRCAGWPCGLSSFSTCFCSLPVCVILSLKAVLLCPQLGAQVLCSSWRLPMSTTSGPSVTQHVPCQAPCVIHEGRGLVSLEFCCLFTGVISFDRTCCGADLLVISLLITIPSANYSPSLHGSFHCWPSCVQLAGLLL